MFPKNKKSLLAWILFFCCTLSIELPGQSLEAFMEIAVENNPGLKSKYLAFEAELQKAAQVSALPDPNISLGAFIFPVETRVGPQRARVGLSQMFPWFGTLAAKKSVVAKRAEAKYAMFLQARNELFYKVKMAWYPLYTLEEELRLQNEQALILASLKELALAKYENGKGKMVDVLRVDLMAETVQTEIQLLNRKRESLKRSFNLLLSRSMEAPIVIQDSLSPLEGTLAPEKEVLENDHPLLLSLDKNIEAVKKQEELGLKEAMPTFGLGLSYIYVSKREDMAFQGNGRDALMPSITMDLPIYRGKHRAKIKEARLLQEMYRTEKNETLNELNSSLEIAKYDLEYGIELERLNKRLIETTRRAQELTLIDYSQSGQGMEEVLRLQQDLIRYQIAKAKALEKSYLSLARLDFITAKSESYEE